MNVEKIQSYAPGLGLCLVLALPCWWLGQRFPIIGGPVIAILLGMGLSLVLPPRSTFQPGISFAASKVLQIAVIFLGFGMNLAEISQTGLASLPIIILTIASCLVVAYFLSRALGIDWETATLVGVGSSICGGSAIAATAPVIKAKEDNIAQAMSVIFFFNVLAALFFPLLGQWLGFSTVDGRAFGLFAGTAVNDTSSVVATASTWDSLFNLGTQTLDQAVTVKLTRTLAIIPITLVLGWWQARGKGIDSEGSRWGQIRSAFPSFIAYFILASVVTTVVTNLGASPSIFVPLSQVSKFLIMVAMLAIGLQSNPVKMIRSGIRPILLGFTCWVTIILVSLSCQHLMGVW